MCVGRGCAVSHCVALQSSTDVMGPIEPNAPRCSPMRRSMPAASHERFQTKAVPLSADLAEFAFPGGHSPKASPGAGLGTILGSVDVEKQPLPSPGALASGARIPSRTPICTGSAYMTGEQDVKLYMYDLSNGIAKTLSPMLGSWLNREELDGVWHSGVVVFGQEYFFNGDLVHVSPGETMWGSPTKVVTIGHTTCSQNALHQFVVDKLRNVFNKSSYDALHNNCNHFADRVCMYLCHRHIPDHILQQPDKLAKLPALRLLRPLLDQWLGGGTREAGEECLESPAPEDERHPSSPSRRRSARRKGASIVRASSLEPGEAQRLMMMERSRSGLARLPAPGPVSSPAASPRRRSGREPTPAAAFREATGLESGRAPSRKFAEEPHGGGRYLHI